MTSVASSLLMLTAVGGDDRCAAEYCLKQLMLPLKRMIFLKRLIFRGTRLDGLVALIQEFQDEIAQALVIRWLNSSMFSPIEPARSFSKVSRLSGWDRRRSFEQVLHSRASVRVRNPSHVTNRPCANGRRSQFEMPPCVTWIRWIRRISRMSMPDMSRWEL